VNFLSYGCCDEDVLSRTWIELLSQGVLENCIPVASESGYVPSPMILKPLFSSCFDHKFFHTLFCVIFNSNSWHIQGDKFSCDNIVFWENALSWRLHGEYHDQVLDGQHCTFHHQVNKLHLRASWNTGIPDAAGNRQGFGWRLWRPRHTSSRFRETDHTGVDVYDNHRPRITIFLRMKESLTSADD